MTRCLLATTLIVMLNAWPQPAPAAVVAYTDRSAFESALAALAGGPALSQEGFDSYAPGTTIANGTSLGALRYEYGSSGNDLAGSGVQLQVSSGFGTTSGARYLGTSDGGVFQSGDDFALTFAPAQAVGMYFISGDALLDGDITLSAGSATASLSVADEQPFGLADGRVFFLGLIDHDGSFTRADIRSFCSPCGSFLFNIDDVVTATVPLPSTLALAAIGLVALQWRRPKAGCRNPATPTRRLSPPG